MQDLIMAHLTLTGVLLALLTLVVVLQAGGRAARRAVVALPGVLPALQVAGRRGRALPAHSA